MATRTLSQSKSAVVVSIPKTSPVIPFRPVREIGRKRWRQLGRMLAPAPNTFEQAIHEGWKVAVEETVLGADRRHRYGAMVLVKEGTKQRLTVAYAASVKAGYCFEKPEAV